MPNTTEPTKIIPDNVLVADYFAIYSEPHRRYETVVKWPCYVLHVAKYFRAGVDKDESNSPPPITSISKLLTCAFTGWKRRAVNPLTGDLHFTALEENFFEKFSSYRRSQTGETTDVLPADEVRFFDAVPAHIDPIDPYRVITARVEIHAEYLSMTIFIPIDFADTEISTPSATKISAEETTGIWKITRSTSDPDAKQLCEYLYDDFPAALFNNPADMSTSTQTCMARLLDLVRAPKAGDPFAADGIFANFNGLVAPSSIFPKARSQPTFAEPWLTAPFQPEAKMENTIKFLYEIDDCLKKSVFKSSTQDVIANYMRNGSAIYLSNLGAQSASNSKDPLRFMVLYDPLSRYRSNTVYRKEQKWWLSRFVGRLLLTGTTRLHALRHIREISQAADRLGGIELRIEEIERGRNPGSILPLWSEHGKLTKELNRLRSVLSIEPDALLRRVNSNRITFQNMLRQLEDLDITAIPGWQSYKSLINRRMITTYERLGDVGERYNNLWMILRTRMEALEALASIRLSRMAAVIAGVAVPAALADPATKILTPVVSFLLLRPGASLLRYWHWRPAAYDAVLVQYWLYFVCFTFAFVGTLLFISNLGHERNQSKSSNT